MNVIITSVKGGFGGTVEQAAEWLAEMQPAYSAVVDATVGPAEATEEPIEVDGTPDAAGWQKGIEDAIGRMDP